jgi:hypothetical protein
MAALQSYGLGFGPSESCVPSKSCHIMVEADSHLTLLPTPTSMLDTYNKLEHIHMLSIGT